MNYCNAEGNRYALLSEGDVTNIRVLYGYPPALGTFFADLTGDRRADGIAVNHEGIYAMLSDGTKLTNWSRWSTAFYVAISWCTGCSPRRTDSPPGRSEDLRTYASRQVVDRIAKPRQVGDVLARLMGYEFPPTVSWSEPVVDTRTVLASSYDENTTFRGVTGDRIEVRNGVGSSCCGAGDLGREHGVVRTMGDKSFAYPSLPRAVSALATPATDELKLDAACDSC
jgi:hypothetical protein